jgi:hypothetical protein
MKDFQQRVIDEKKELDEKMGKLHKFITSDFDWTGVTPAECKRLTKQYSIMMEYSRVLGERIADFVDGKPVKDDLPPAPPRAPRAPEAEF